MKYTTDILEGLQFNITLDDTLLDDTLLYTVSNVNGTRCRVSWYYENSVNSTVNSTDYQCADVCSFLNDNSWIETEDSKTRRKIEKFLEE